MYDSSGKKKTTIGSKGSGEVQFQSPNGIDISGEVVYVAECGGHRIHKLTTGGEYIGVFGKRGSGIGEFNYPLMSRSVLMGRCMLQTETMIVSRYSILTGLSLMLLMVLYLVMVASLVLRGIAFDLSGNVHVGGVDSSSVTVFTPSGQFVRQYDKTHTNSPTGIAIDPSGYSLVNNKNTWQLSTG